MDFPTTPARYTVGTIVVLLHELKEVVYPIMACRWDEVSGYNYLVAGKWWTQGSIEPSGHFLALINPGSKSPDQDLASFAKPTDLFLAKYLTIDECSKLEIDNRVWLRSWDNTLWLAIVASVESYKNGKLVDIEIVVNGRSDSRMSQTVRADQNIFANLDTSTLFYKE
jgi:hypothetical protein